MQLAHVMDSGALEWPACDGDMPPEVMSLKTLGKPTLAKTVRPTSRRIYQNELATDRGKMGASST